MPRSELVQRGLELVGLNVEDPCSVPTLNEKIRDKLKEYKKDVDKTINSLSARSFGTFLVTLGFLMAQLAAGAGLAVLDSLVVHGIFGNILGTVTMMVGLALSSLTGAFIMLQYLAVSHLHDVLLKRIEFGQLLEAEITQMISFFQGLARHVEETKQENIDDIRRALEYVKDAHLRVGSEAGRISQDGSPVDSRKLEDAQDLIDQAINELTTGGFGATKKALRDLQKEFELNVDLGIFDATVPDINGFVNYLNALSAELDRKFFSEDLSKQELKRNTERVKSVILRLIPELPTAVRKIAYIQLFEVRTKRLFDHIPVEVRLINDLRNQIKESIGNAGALRVPDEILKFFETTVPEAKKDTFPDTTYWALTTEVKLAEASIIMLPDWMEKIKFEAGVFKNLLLPANRKLAKVKSEMQGYVNKDIEYISQVVDVSKKKMEWSVELDHAKGLIKGAIGPAISFNGSKTYPSQDSQRFQEAQVIFDELQQFIENKQNEDIRFADEVYNVAQRYLSSLALGNVSLFAPGVARNVLAGLQAIRFALREQLEQDEQEVSLAQQFIHKVDQSVFFRQVIKPSWEEFISSLQSSTAGMAIIGRLAKGDLSSIIDALEQTRAVSKVVDVVRCIAGKKETEQAKDQFDQFSDILAANAEREGIEDFREWYENFRKDAEEAINTLDDRKRQLDTLQSEVV